MATARLNTATIHLTKEELALLLKLLYIGDWVVSAHRVPPYPEYLNKYEQIERRILEQAERNGLADYVHRPNRKPDHACPSTALEDDEEVRRLIDEYDNDTFWEELANRIAMREAIRLYGEDGLFEMEESDRVDAIGDLYEKYLDMFTQRGLDVIDVAEDYIK